MRAANVRPITELKNRTKELVREVSDSGQSLVITRNGKPAIVLMDIKQHDRLQDTLAMLKLLAQSQDALAKTGRVYSTEQIRRRARISLEKSAKQ